MGNFLGLPPLSTADLGLLGIAAAIIAAIALAAHILTRRLCRWVDRAVLPKLDLAERKTPLAGNHLAAAGAAVAATAFLSLAAAGYRWPPYSDLLFDLAIVFAAAIARATVA